MDVDVGGTPEPESMGADDMARDGESDLIVQQLERGLPRWEGFGDFGWMMEKEGSEDHWLELVLAIKAHKDTVYVPPPSPSACHKSQRPPFSGNRYATVLEAMPEETNIPYLSFSVRHGLASMLLISCLTIFQSPLSLKLVEVGEPLPVPYPSSSHPT